MQIIKNKIFTLFTLLFLLVFGGWSSLAWGNSVSSANSSEDVIDGKIVMSGNHATFTFTASGKAISNAGWPTYTYELGSIEHGKTRECTFTWEPNEGCSIKVTKIEFGVRGYTSNALRTGEMKAVFNGTTKDIGSIVTNYTTFSETNNKGFSSGIKLTLKNTCGGHGLFSKSYDKYDYYIGDISITYTITPNAPTIKETTATINVSLSDENKLDMTTLIGVSDVTDFMPVSFESNSYNDPLNISNSGAYTFTGNYFYATKAGVYTFTKPYVAAKNNCHTASSKANGSVTITVNRLDPTLNMDNGTVGVTQDPAHPVTLDLSSLKLSSSTSGIGAFDKFEVVGADASTGARAAGVTISGSTFYSVVGGNYTVRATTKQTNQYNSTYKDFTVTVNRETQTINWSTNETTFVEEDVISATSLGDVTLEATGAGALLLSIEGNKATVGEVEVNTTATLTATAAQTDVYAQATDSKTITLTSLQKQHITFDQNLTKLKTTDGTKKVELEATSDSGRDSYIYFTCEANDKGVSVGQEGGKWYLYYTTTAAKGIMVTAHLDGVPGVSVDASPVSQMVKVTDPTATCDITEGLATASKLVETTKEYDLTIPKKVVLKVRSSKSRPYTNSYEIRFYDKNGTEKSTAGTHSWTGRSWDQTIDTRTFDNLDKSITKMVFTSHASNGFDITEASYTRWSYANTSVEELNYEAYALSTVADQSFTLDYANYQVELSIEGSSNFVLKSADSFGDCEKYGSQTVTVGYNVPATAQEETAYLHIKDNTGAKIHDDIVLYANVLGGLTQNITSTNIKSSYWTTDSVHLNATTDRGLTNFSYTGEPAEVVNIDGSLMTFNKSGVISVTVNEAGNATFDAATTTVSNIKINKVTPTIATKPSGISIKYRQELSNSKLSGGTATVTLRGVANTTVAGSFAWTEPTHVVTDAAGDHDYQVTFTPTDGGMYNSNTCMVPITILRATQAIKMNNGTVKVAVTGIDAGKADSKIDLDNLIKSQTSDVVNAVKRDGNVTYAVISANADKATIDGNNVFSATEIGEYTIRATKARTAYYNEVTDDFTVTVGKRANTLTTTASYTKYVDDEVTEVATVVNSDGTIHTWSSDASIAYYDIVNNKIVIPNSEAKSFNQTTVTIKIWQDATARFEGVEEASAKTITLTVKKHSNTITYSWANQNNRTWTEFLNFDDGAYIHFTSDNKNAQTPIVVTQTSGENIATFYPDSVTVDDPYGDAIYASFNIGQAEWTVAQAENYKYVADEKHLRVNVGKVAAPDCEVTIYERQQEDQADAISFDLDQDGYKLYFQMRRNVAGGMATLQTSTDGSEWESKVVVTTEVSAYEDKEVELSAGTRHIKFARFGADNPYINNIRVTTRTKYFNIENTSGSAITELTMPTNTLSGTEVINSTTETFVLDYITCEDEIKLESNNPHITVSPSTINTEVNHKGKQTITLTYASNQRESIDAIITAYSHSDHKTLLVHAATERQSQNIIWNEGYTNTPLSLPVGLNTNSAASATSNLTVTYDTNNDAVIRISGDSTSFEIIAKGEASLIAKQNGSDLWAPVSDSKVVNATDKKIQNIRWNQSFTRGIQVDDVISLEAQVYIVNLLDGTSAYNADRTALVSYSCPDANGVIEIVDGNKIHVLNTGETTITASAPGDAENYEAATLTKRVYIRVVSEGECDNEPVFYQSGETEFFQISLDAMYGEPIAVNTTDGIPDKLSFDIRGKVWSLAIDYYRGGIIAEQTIDNGEHWTRVYENAVAPSAGKTASYGPYQLAPNATHIRFMRPYGAHGYHYVGNIVVSRLPILEATRTNINLGTFPAGSTIPGSVTINYADVKQDLTVEMGTDDSQLTLNEDLIEVDCGATGSYNLGFQVKPMNVGDWENTIIITDPKTSKSTTVTVTATISIGEQSISWNPTTTIYPTQAPVLNATSTSNLPVSYAITAGDDVASIVNGVVVINSLGEFTITASQAGDGVNFKAAANVEKTFTVTAIPLTLIAPTASSITDAQTLSASVLTGGTATDNNDDEVSGSWAWESPETVYSEGTYYPTVVFTPSVNPNWYSGNTTTTMVEVTLSSYRYTGDGEWSNTSHWNTGSVPGAEDNVIISGHVTINSDAEVKSLTIEESSNVSVVVNGSLTINGKSADRANYGDLFVKNGGSVVMAASSDLKVKDLIIEARLGNVEHPGSSGQISRKELVNVKGDVYFKLSLEPDGSRATLGWYDFVVPFEVDVIGGITIADAPTTPMVFNSNYAVMAYDESKRAANGKAWNKYTGTLVPGKVYTIAIDDAYDWTTVLFKKKQGASINPNTSLSTSYSNVGNEGDRGWNGLGNGTLQHCQLNLSAISVTPKIQVYDHKNDNYITLDAPSYTCAIGTSFFVQVPNTAPAVSLSAASQQNRGGGGKFFAPAREDKTITEFCLALTMEGDEIVSDRLWVSANEAATGEYVIGQDLAKLGELKSSKLARMWAKNKDMNLCDIEMPLVYGQASCELNMYAPKQATYTLAVEEAPEDAELFLTYNGKVIWNLTSSPAEIVLNPGVKTDFGLILKSHNASEIAEGVDNIDEDNHSVRKVLIDNIIYVITPDGAMYDVNGKLIR